MTYKTLMRELERAARAAGSQKALAHQYGISQSLLCRVLDGTYDPPAKLLTAMGYRRVIRYERVT